jgi:hypothetical protein
MNPGEVNRMQLPVLSRVHRCLATLGVVTALLVGCETYEELPGGEFGASVRHMVALQTADPEQEARGLDGPKARKALDQYRNDVAKPKEAEKPVINLKIGG